MATILLKRGPEATIPALNVGEPGFTTDTFKLYIGSSAGNQLIGPSSGGVSDGDKGDITVSSSGSVWTIDAGVVTFAKMQDISTGKLVGRSTAGTGDPEEISVGSGLSLSGGTLSATGGVSDGDKGDITVSSSGSVWTIDPRAVTIAKIQEFETGILLGRWSIGTGDLETIELEAPLAFSTSSLSISDGGITFAKIQDINEFKLLGRGDGDGEIEMIQPSSMFALDGAELALNDASVTFAKLQDISTDRLLGRSTAGSGSVEQLTIGAGLSLSGGSLSAREVSFTTLYKWGF